MTTEGDYTAMVEGLEGEVKILRGRIKAALEELEHQGRHMAKPAGYHTIEEYLTGQLDEHIDKV